jgi:hypothetical protein
MNYTYLHFDVAEWLVKLTSGAPTDVIHRVLLAVHLNSFYCPLLFENRRGSTTKKVSSVLEAVLVLGPSHLQRRPLAIQYLPSTFLRVL